MIFVTGNDNKLREFEGILGIKLERESFDLDEIQSVEVEEVAKHKAAQAYSLIGKPVIVEDTGLFFEELNGLPGALIKFFLKKLGLEKICSLVKENRRAVARTCVAYADAKGVQIFTGETAGRIASAPQGESGFGWDPIFIPDGQERSFAEMTEAEKQGPFMRRLAIEKLKEYVEKEGLQ